MSVRLTADVDLAVLGLVGRWLFLIESNIGVWVRLGKALEIAKGMNTDAVVMHLKWILSRLLDMVRNLPEAEGEGEGELLIEQSSP